MTFSCSLGCPAISNIPAIGQMKVLFKSIAQFQKRQLASSEIGSCSDPTYMA